MHELGLQQNNSNQMSLQNTRNIDIVVKSLEGVPNGLELYVVDDGSITDEVERYTALVDKLSSYVGYVISDDFAQSHPHTTANDVVIRVLCKHPPNAAMLTVQAVRPRGEHITRVPVVFEDLDAFIAGHYTAIKE